MIVVRWGKRTTWVLLTGGLVAVAGARLWLRDKEPVYNGKTLTLWLKTYRHPDNPTINDLFPGPTLPIDIPTDGLISISRTERNRREAAELERRQLEAAEAVRHIGTNAIPSLLRGIDRDMPMWRLKLAVACSQLPRALPGHRFLDWWLVASYEFRVEHAITGFLILNSNATMAVPELTRRMSTRKSRSGQLAIIALAKIGHEGLDSFLAALANTNAENRVLVARAMDEAIRNQGTNAERAAVRALAKCLGDPDPGVALWSAITLGNLTVEPDISVPALTKALSDPRAQMRGRCAEALGHFAQAASSAVPSLQAIVSDSDPFVKVSTTTALQKIAPGVTETNGPQ